jgi:hypothetical protein
LVFYYQRIIIFLNINFLAFPFGGGMDLGIFMQNVFFYIPYKMRCDDVDEMTWGGRGFGKSGRFHKASVMLANPAR